MKTKEEILDNVSSDTNDSGTVYDEFELNNAFDEYAKQLAKEVIRNLETSSPKTNHLFSLGYKAGIDAAITAIKQTFGI